MTHQWFEQYMNDLSSRGLENYLADFELIHDYWHGTNRFLGFLSFHRTVIATLEIAMNDAGMNLPGPWTTQVPAYDTSIDAITVAEDFSLAIEMWHNRVHNNTDYSELMNPRTNIYTYRFWGLHMLIDKKFTEWLNTNNINFEDVDHNRV